MTKLFECECPRLSKLGIKIYSQLYIHTISEGLNQNGAISLKHYTKWCMFTPQVGIYTFLV